MVHEVPMRRCVLNYPACQVTTETHITIKEQAGLAEDLMWVVCLSVNAPGLTAVHKCLA